MPNHEVGEQIEEQTANLATVREQLVASEKTLEEQLQFERLLSNLSFRFTKVSFDELDIEIEHSLRQILEFFGVDRCFLIRLSEDKTAWQITHAAVADGLPPTPNMTEIIQFCQKLFNPLVVVFTVSNLASMGLQVDL